jgi:CTP synthase (UTP-ammonia lyase)
VRFVAGSRLAQIYGGESAQEGYHCSYGVNQVHRAALERAGLRFTAFDEHGEIRGAELAANAHPFFIGTLFQPERAALRGETPPVVRALVRAAAERGEKHHG